MNRSLSRRSALKAATALALPISTRPIHSIAQSTPVADIQTSWIPALGANPANWPASIAASSHLERYFAAIGAPMPQTIEGDDSDLWMGAFARLPLTDHALYANLAVDWLPLVGFTPFDVTSATSAFDPPGTVRYYQGAFDPERIAQAFTDQGYEIEQDGDFTFCRNPRGDALDLSNELSRMTLGAFSFVAASTSAVVATRSDDLLQSVVAVHDGEEESLWSGGRFRSLDEAAQSMLGYVLLNGSFLMIDPFELMERGEYEPIPPVLLFLAGYGIDERGDETTHFVLDFATEDDAKQAMPVVADRIDTAVSLDSGEPFAETFTGYAIEIEPKSSRVRVTVPGELMAQRWLRMVFARDTFVFATG